MIELGILHKGDCTLLYQWDTGRKLLAKGVDVGSEAHFVHPLTRQVMAMLFYQEEDLVVCKIPDALLQISKPFNVYVYVACDEGKATAYRAVFPVAARPKPPGYIYEEDPTEAIAAYDARLLTLTGGGNDTAQEDILAVNAYLAQAAQTAGVDASGTETTFALAEKMAYVAGEQQQTIEDHTQKIEELFTVDEALLRRIEAGENLSQAQSADIVALRATQAEADAEIQSNKQSIADVEEAVEAQALKLSTQVLTKVTMLVEGDSAYIETASRNLQSGQEQTSLSPMQLANEEQAGLMSPSDYRSLVAIGQRVNALEGKTSRILYTERTEPTQEQINEFAISRGFAAPFAGVAVVVDSVYHVWHYYENDSIGWRDDGVDTVSAFTNESAGSIRGEAVDGKVFAETDGTGSVFGWTELKARVANTEASKQDSLTFDPYPTSGSANPVTSDGVASAMRDTESAAMKRIDERVSLKNYFVNPFFTINQRGITSITNTTYSYDKPYERFIADRWQVYADDMNGAWSVVNTGASIVMDNTLGQKRIILRQMIALNDFKPLLSKDFTFTFCLSLNGGDKQIYSISSRIDDIKDAEGTGKDYCALVFDQETEREKKSNMRVYAPADATKLAFDVYLMPTDTAEVFWAKLECNDKYSPIQPIDYQEELTKCRRYYQELHTLRLPLTCHTTGIMEWYVPLDGRMSDIPTIVVNQSMILVNKFHDASVIAIDTSVKPWQTRYAHDYCFTLYNQTVCADAAGALCSLSGKSGRNVPIICYTDQT